MHGRGQGSSSAVGPEESLGKKKKTRTLVFISKGTICLPEREGGHDENWSGNEPFGEEEGLIAS